MYKVNKQVCTGCQVCIQNCPGATKIGADGKAEVIDQKKLESCGGEKVCPFGAIEKTEEGKESEGNNSEEPNPTPLDERRTGQGRGMGRGMGKGQGRGFGLGPRGGRGRGMGRGRK